MAKVTPHQRRLKAVRTRLSENLDLLEDVANACVRAGGYSSEESASYHLRRFLEGGQGVNAVNLDAIERELQSFLDVPAHPDGRAASEVLLDLAVLLEEAAVVFERIERGEQGWQR